MNRTNLTFRLLSAFFLTFIIFFSACDKDDPFDAMSGTFTDERDGHQYKWVKIGEQIWMAENLAYIPFQPCASDEQCGVWVYNYEGEGSYGSMLSTYGCLYDWDTAMEVCPDGWHIPSDEEWMELERFLGMPEDELYIENIGRGVEANVAGKLGAGSSLWNEPNENSTNETDFSLKPGGMRTSDGYFHGIGDRAVFWTSSQHPSVSDWVMYRSIHFGVVRYYFDGKQGLSIRCTKD